MAFTTEEEIDLKSQYGWDIPELLIQGYTEEDIRGSMDESLQQPEFDLTSTAPQEPDPLQSLRERNVDVDSYLNQGYSIDDILDADPSMLGIDQAISAPAQQVAPPQVQQPQSQLGTQPEETSFLGDMFGVLKGEKNLGDVQTVGGMTLDDIGKGITGALSGFTSAGGFGAEKAGEFAGIEGLQKFGQDIQQEGFGSEDFRQFLREGYSEGGKKELETRYEKPGAVKQLVQKIKNGEEITLDDLDLIGDVSPGKLLHDVAIGTASLPLLFTGLGVRAGLLTLGASRGLASFFGIGGTFSVTEGLSMGKSVHDLSMSMSGDELRESPMFNSVSGVISEKFPDATPAEIEDFARKQIANQLSFEYGSKAALFSLITEGGVGAFAFKRVRNQLKKAQAKGVAPEVAKAARKTFMRSVGRVATVTGLEFAQEFGQESYNKLLENFASNRAGRPVEPLTDVLESGATGGMGSMATGPMLGLAAEVSEHAAISKELEAKDMLQQAQEEDVKIEEEAEEAGLPKGVRPTDSPDLWFKPGFDDAGRIRDYLIGIVPNDEGNDVFKITLPDPAGGEAIMFNNEFATILEASTFIEQIGRKPGTDEGDDEEEVVEEEPPIVDEEPPTEEPPVEEPPVPEGENVIGGLTFDQHKARFEKDGSAEFAKSHSRRQLQAIADTFGVELTKDDLKNRVTMSEKIFGAKETPVVEEEPPTEEPPVEEPPVTEKGKIDPGTAETVILKAQELMKKPGSIVDDTIFDMGKAIGENFGKQYEQVFLDEAKRISDENIKKRKDEEKGKTEEEEEVIDEEPTEEPPDEDAIPTPGTLADLKKQEAAVLNEIEDLKFIDPSDQSIPIFDDELKEIQDKIKQIESGEAKTTDEIIEEKEPETEAEPTVESATSTDRIRYRAKDHGFGMELRPVDDVHTVIVYDKKFTDKKIGSAVIGKTGNIDNVQIFEAESKKEIKEAIKEASEKIKAGQDQPSARKTTEPVNKIFDQPSQKISSAKTSQAQTPKGANTIIEKALVKAGDLIADIGGGVHDIATKIYKKAKITNLVWDPFNRTKSHNDKVARKIQNGQADASTIFNVLNVIKEKFNRIATLKRADNATKEGGKIFISVYEDKTQGDERESEGLGRGGSTTKGWQNRQPLSWYLKEVESVFGKENVTTKHGMIIVTKKTKKASETRGDQPQSRDEPEEREVDFDQSPLKKIEGVIADPKTVVSKKHIRDWFSKTFGKRIKGFGTIISKQAGGLFYPRSETVRTKQWGDLETIAHEMAHFMEKIIDRAFSRKDGVTINGKNYKKTGFKVERSVWLNLKRKMLPEGVQEELASMDYEPDKGRNFEGFAEYFRYLLSGVDMTKPFKTTDGRTVTAVKFHKFFMETLLGNKEIQAHFKDEFGINILEKIEEIKVLYKKWYQQGAFNRISAGIDGYAKSGDAEMGKIRKAWQWFREFMYTEYDQLHLLQKKVEEINAIRKRNGLPKLSPSNDPFQVATANKLAHITIANTLIGNAKHAGVINHNGELILIVTEPGGTTLKKGQKITERELDETNKKLTGKKVKAKADRMKTLVESLAPIGKKDMHAFTIYGLALRASNIDKRLGRGKAGFYGEDIDEILNNKEKYGWKESWDQAWKDVTDWNGVLLDWLVDAGRLSTHMRALFQEANPIYLPFKRALDDNVRSTGNGGDGMTPSALKRLTGSDRPILNPLEAMIEHTTTMISLAIRSRVLSILADNAPLHGVGDIITKVPGQLKSMDTQMGPLKKQLKAIFARTASDLTEEQEDEEAQRIAGRMSAQFGSLVDKIDETEMLTVFWRDKQTGGKKDNKIVPIHRDGNVFLYEVDHELYEVVQQMSRFESDSSLVRGAMMVLRPFASLARIGWTGLNAKFNLWTNPLRDIPLASIYSKQGKAHPGIFVKGIWTALKQGLLPKSMQTEEWTPGKRYTAGGGNLATMHGADHAMYEAQTMDLSLRAKGIEKTILMFKNPLKGLQMFLGGIHGFLSTTELGPRLAEFEGVYNVTKELQRKAEYKKANDKKLTEEETEHLNWTEEDHYINATIAGRDITFNFTKTGKIGKYINQVFPFHNATMQGPNKAYRAFSTRPIMTLLRSLIYITMPAMVSWHLSKDEEWYKNIQNSYNDLNLFFEASRFPVLKEMLESQGYDPSEMIIAFPIPHETGILFGSIPRAALDELVLKREGALLESIKSAIKMVLPTFVKKPWMAQAWAPILEVDSNTSHFGRTIVPPYMLNTYQPKPVEDQVFPWTSKLAKAMSKVLVRISDYTKTSEVKFNPIQLDYMMKQYTGGLATQFITMTEDEIFGTKSGRRPWSVTLHSPHRPTRQMEIFYNEMNELRGLKSVERATTKQLNRLKKMNKFKKDYLDGASKKRRAIGDNGIPTNEKERTKIGKIYKKSARDLNRFLGKEHEDLKR